MTSTAVRLRIRGAGGVHGVLPLFFCSIALARATLRRAQRLEQQKAVMDDRLAGMTAVGACRGAMTRLFVFAPCFLFAAISDLNVTLEKERNERDVLENGTRRCRLCSAQTPLQPPTSFHSCPQPYTGV